MSQNVVHRTRFENKMKQADKILIIYEDEEANRVMEIWLNETLLFMNEQEVNNNVKKIF